MFMNVIDALNSRHTCRAFKPDPVSKDTIVKILKAANKAPSWGNTQPWEVYVATGKVLEDLRKESVSLWKQNVDEIADLPLPQTWPERLLANYNIFAKERNAIIAKEISTESIPQYVQSTNAHFFNAPVILYICMDRSLTAYSMLDIGSFIQSIMLAAQEFGLATAPAIKIAIRAEIIHKALGIPDNMAIVLGIAMGYEDKDDIYCRFRSSRVQIEEKAIFKGF
jgi:nitroreductase